MPSDYRQLLVYILCQHQKVTGSPILDQASEQLFHSSQQSQTMANHREGSNQDSITSAARATSTLSQHKNLHIIIHLDSVGLGYTTECWHPSSLSQLIGWSQLQSSSHHLSISVHSGNTDKWATQIIKAPGPCRWSNGSLQATAAA
jgi:hypothetical protein